MSVITFMKDLLKTVATPKTGCGACVRFKHMNLPPAHMRQCTAEVRDDEYFVASAEREVRKLVEHCELNGDSRILEIGCGSGRLPIGLISTNQSIANYVGVDVDVEAIRWCERWIASEHSKFQFAHIDVHNERYNPKGAIRLDDRFRFEVVDQSCDIIYLYSVFTHMEIDDVKVYLREFKRNLAPEGRVFLTAYLEDDVPDVTVNPPEYRQKYRGPLHRIRFDRDFFEDQRREHGLRMCRFDHQGEHDRQSGVYLAHA